MKFKEYSKFNLSDVNKEVLKETLIEKYSDLYVVYRDASHDKDEEESAFY